MSFNTDTDVVVSGAVNSTVNLLKAAAKEPSVKSVVLTSSSSAALIPEPNKEFGVVNEGKTDPVPEQSTIQVQHADLCCADTWNDEAVKAAYDKDTPKDLLPFAVYAASKTQGERAFWDFAKTNNPSFAVNTVLPNMAVSLPVPVLCSC